MSSTNTPRVCITGAAGQIAYSLIFRIAQGDLLGAEQPVILHLLDIPMMEERVAGVVMEIEDLASPIVEDVVATSDVEAAFTDVDYVIMVGAFPRRDGMERKDLLARNVGIFKEQGEAMNQFAKKDVKVLVVGNPANTNCAVARTFAPDIPAENFSALTRLDQNRARFQVAKKLGTNVSNVSNVVIWGNHSSTQFPDLYHATANGKSVLEQLQEAGDEAWINETFVGTVQTRGAAVIKARQLSSAASAANAILDHMKDWLFGTAEGEYTSMAVVSDGSYGITKDIMFSFPVTCADGKYTIVQDLDISKFPDELKTTEDELVAEFTLAKQIISESENKKE